MMMMMMMLVKGLRLVEIIIIKMKKSEFITRFIMWLLHMHNH